ncbi:MAG TPA: WecB/TagA/CpsF family glycosyltransferase [Polyangia bacterium]|jgi:N-acetylglucosaminyldiphosphoundecaprenol N-acetyl-beta-D-mannosaminyltransferase|nr:WecB/TagA/CpsF family glycosyltransferase [Polyangia bacterium]
MSERIQMGRLPIDVVDFAGALSAIEALVRAGKGGMVFTPNVDHVVLAERDDRLQAAYSRVSLSLVDGTPVLWAARLFGQPLPEKVSGSDLVIPLVERAAAQGWRLFLLGGAPGVGALATAELEARFPTLKIVGTAAPQIELGADPSARRAIAREIATTRPDLVLVAFGAPKQEIFCDDTRDLLSPAVMVCVGAGIDFIAGTARRAPAWLSRYGLEWAYRLAQEPRRMAGRYLLRDPEFLVILARQWWRRTADRDSSAPR